MRFGYYKFLISQLLTFTWGLLVKPFLTGKVSLSRFCKYLRSLLILNILLFCLLFSCVCVCLIYIYISFFKYKTVISFKA